MASSLGRPIVVEGGGGLTGTEIMDMTTFEWSPGTAQPFHRFVIYEI